jgi:phospholipase/carboxylesterase
MHMVAVGLAMSLFVLTSGCEGRSTPVEAGPKVDAAPSAAPASSSALSTWTITLPPLEPPASRLVVMLHGLGRDAESFVDVGYAVQSATPHAEVLVPDGLHPFDGGRNGPGDGGVSGRQWLSLRGLTEENLTARMREAGEEVSSWIDAELAWRGLGGDRLVIIGISQGAIMGAWLAMHREPRPAAVVMLSGRVRWVEDRGPPAGAAAVPVLIANGDPDPVEPSATVLESWGARVTRRAYPGARHGEVNAHVLADVTDFLKTALGDE